MRTPYNHPNSLILCYCCRPLFTTSWFKSYREEEKKTWRVYSALDQSALIYRGYTFNPLRIERAEGGMKFHIISAALTNHNSGSTTTQCRNNRSLFIFFASCLHSTTMIGNMGDAYKERGSIIMCVVPPPLLFIRTVDLFLCVRNSRRSQHA